MEKKAYLSTLSAAWPIERQREKLGTRIADYVDVMHPATLARIRAGTLTPDKALRQRGDMLRPSSRKEGEIIEVASLVCLAVNTADFLAVVAAAGARRAVIHALDTGAEIATAADLARALPAFQQALRGRELGRSRAQRAAEQAEESRRRAMLVADDYGRPDSEVPMHELRARAADKDGKPMAPATLVKYLGRRKDAQRLRAAGLKRSATAAAKREEQANAE